MIFYDKGLYKVTLYRLTKLALVCLIFSVYVCIDAPRAWVQTGGTSERGGRKCRAQRVWVGTLFSTERSPLFSMDCLPHHRSYQATLYRLNGLAGMSAPHNRPFPSRSLLTRALFVLHSFLLFLILSILLSSAKILYPLGFHHWSVCYLYSSAKPRSLSIKGFPLIFFHLLFSFHTHFFLKKTFSKSNW